jgi:hypothetical protein
VVSIPEGEEVPEKEEIYNILVDVEFKNEETSNG